jgi:hypothetical protein
MFASFDNWLPERMLLRERKEVDKIAPFVHQTLKVHKTGGDLITDLTVCCLGCSTFKGNSTLSHETIHATAKSSQTVVHK